MAGFQIPIDTSDADKKLEVLKHIQGGAPKATRMALNKTVTGMRTDAGREIASRYTIAQKHFKDRMTLKKASSSDLSIELASRDRSIRSTYFAFKPNQDPGVEGAPSVYVKYKKGGNGKYTGGFIATMPGQGGLTSAFVRTGEFDYASKGRYKGKLREKIEVLDGPGVVQMLHNAETRNTIQVKAAKRFTTELDRAVNKLLSKG